MRKSVRSLAVASLLSLAPLTSQAAEVRGLFNVGYDFGGDRLVTVIYTDGSSDFVDANRGIFFGGGVAIVWDPAGAMETQLTLNYKFEETDPFASGGVKFSTTQFDAVQAFNVSPQLSLGVGLTYHMSPKVAGTGVISGTAQYDDAAGALFQLGFRLSDRSQIGLRYTNITYKGRGLASADGSGFGVFFNIGFGGNPSRRGPAW
jgi:hypothetical protein